MVVGGMKRILDICLFIAVFVSSSCSHKELCYHHPHVASVQINADWTGFEKDRPSGMTVMVYSRSGDKVIEKQTNNTSFAIVDLLVGYYNSVVYNQSPEEYGTVEFRGMDKYPTAQVCASPIDSRWYKTRGEKEVLAVSPEWIGTDRVEDIEITQRMVDITGENKLANMNTRDIASDFIVARHHPENIIYTIGIKVHLKNVYNLKSARASLDGLAEGFMFSTGMTTESEVTHLLENWRLVVDKNDPTMGYIEASITSFGLPCNHKGLPGENKFNLSVLLVDNKTIIDFPFEVGDKFVFKKDEAGKLILECDIELWAKDPLPDVKPEGTGNDGFDAWVEDWGEEENFELEI